MVDTRYIRRKIQNLNIKPMDLEEVSETLQEIKEILEAIAP